MVIFHSYVSLPEGTLPANEIMIPIAQWQAPPNTNIYVADLPPGIDVGRPKDGSDRVELLVFHDDETTW
jgi:hypothetical protein